MLSREDRRHARTIAAAAAFLALRNREAVHYSQGPARWDGIEGRRIAHRGQFPRHADCSAFVTWCLWNALFVPHQIRDVVNGARWKAGFTGTMAERGVPIRFTDNIKPADLVVYRGHAAIIVGRRRGVPMVVSHGSEGGPFYLPFNYRSDIHSVRRYIRRGI